MIALCDLGHLVIGMWDLSHPVGGLVIPPFLALPQWFVMILVG